MPVNSLLPVDWAQRSISEIAKLAPIEELRWPLLEAAGVRIFVKREDLLDPILSGNKFYKLLGHVEKYAHSGADCIATFGGGYSNHILATAAIGQNLQVKTIGVVRGHYPVPTPTMVDATAMGMTILAVTREEYGHKNDPGFRQSLQQRIGARPYWIPEGGGDWIGAAGCAHWARQSLSDSSLRPTHICVACGTGGSAAGILAASEDIPVHGFLSLKGMPSELVSFSENVQAIAQSLRNELYGLPMPLPAFHLESRYHYGGYARFPDTLREFMQKLERQLSLPLDPVYTAKLFWGIAEKARLGEWLRGSCLLVFHTGGLQGRRGFPGL